MKLSEVKSKLKELEEIKFSLPNGNEVPAHFHVTEVGVITKNFIDCGGKVREEKKVNFQLWEERDYDHRLAPQKLIAIINKSEKALDIADHDVEVEYQSGTIGKYSLNFENGKFLLTNQETACLALDDCGIPSVDKVKKSISNLVESSESCCSPGGGCC